MLARPDEKSRAGDSAQALMDLGSSICTPKKPACALCPLNEDCAARARGDQETFPRKAPKKTGTLRRGAAFIVTRGDELLVRTRAEKGLLGGMTEVPGSEWLAGQDDKAALKPGALRSRGLTRWHRKAGVVTHVFTHFPLELVVYTARRPRAHAGAGRHALGAGGNAGRRGVSQRDAQGDRARAGLISEVPQKVDGTVSPWIFTQ